MASVLCVLGFVAVAAWPSPPASAEEFVLDPVEARFVSLLNEVRVQQGLRPLLVDPALSGTARIWAARMRDAGSISHNLNLPSAVTADWSKLGENVGSGPDADIIHQKFVESAAHYRNIVDPGFDVIGIGVARAGDLIFITEDFMGLQKAPAPPPTTVARSQAVPQVLAFKAVASARTPVTTTPRRPAPTTRKRRS